MEKKLEVKNLIISFRTDAGKVQAVRDISFDLYKGETLAIVGESGSGKSVTNRAVMGILAGNGMIEGGEILYEGQDLVQISEEDFHKLRGDKIAMIFQDPLSSLNPIMRIGKQLTEAMLLKGKASQRNARKIFNTKLKLLNKSMDALATGNAAKITENAQQVKTFDNFCIKSTKLESHYNEIYRAAVELKVDIDDCIFLLQKKQHVDVKVKVRQFIKRVDATIHPDIVVKTSELETLLNELSDVANNIPNAKHSSEDHDKFVVENVIPRLQSLSAFLEKSAQRPKPNYFTLGYYMMRNPEANLDDMPIDELTAMTRKYLDEEFMLHFIDEGAKALQYSHDVSIAAKKELLEATTDALEYFRSATLDKKVANEKANAIVKQVDLAIDRLEVLKNSIEYTFKSSINSALKKYFAGVEKNPKEQKRFERQTAKRERLIARGKTPDWKVVPAAIFDLELGKKNIRAVLHNLRASLRKDIENDCNFNANEKMVALIDYLKEQASAVVYKVTPKMAKAKALKLMEEVGIPEPAVRYRQYPFEFSGGMRQRIVIAIALAANPDILICDEPTTALDVTIQAQILELINRIKKERHLSVIFITHNLGVVANMADRIAVMYAGKIVEYGTADDVFYDPRHPYTWALLSSMPDLETKEKLEAIPGTPPNMIFPPKGDAFAARNKYAMEIDFEEQPPMFEVSETHYAATWLLHPNAPHVDPPKIVTDRIERMKKKEVDANG